MRLGRAAALLAVALALEGCRTVPEPADVLAAPHPVGREARQRSFRASAQETEKALTTLLQDQGFQVTAAEPSLGLILASRRYGRTWGDYGRALGNDMFLAMGNMFLLRQYQPSPERNYGPAGYALAILVAPQASGSTVRVSLHRTADRITGEAILAWAEPVSEAEPYRQFFGMLGKALGR